MMTRARLIARRNRLSDLMHATVGVREGTVRRGEESAANLQLGDAPEPLVVLG